jgi:hexosaminidase
MPKVLGRLRMKDVNYCDAFYDVLFDYNRNLPFPKMMNLELDCPGADIRYTLDGTEPTRKSMLYSGEPFEVDKGSVIKARGFINGKAIGKTAVKKF